MERLTRRYELGATKRDITITIGDICEKLAEYEDAEEQGLLLRLPCKVGDTVYCIVSRYTECSAYGDTFDDYRCAGCEYKCDNNKEWRISKSEAYCVDWIIANLKYFGSEIFLTKEEAEQKLAEYKGE